MSETPSISRRQVLAASGVASVAVGSYLAGIRTADDAPDWLAGRDCQPSPLATSSTDWPFPRHDRANTGRAPARAGPDWPLEQVWDREWPVGGLHDLQSLVVTDGVVAGLVNAAPRGMLVARALEDGRELWRQPLVDASYGQVCAAGGVAFVEGTSPASTAEFTARSLGDGSVLWSGAGSTHVPQSLAGGRLLTVEREPDPARDDTHFAVTARDARTGVECWRTVHAGRPGDIAVADGRIVLPTRPQGVVALDPASGTEQWRSPAGGDTVAVTGNRVIMQRFPGELAAVSLADGTVDWRVRSEHYLEDGQGDDGREYARPGFDIGAVTAEVVVYVLDVYSEYPQRVQARDLDTGDLLWDVGPDPAPVEFHGYSRPVVVGDDVLTVRYARRAGESDRPETLLRLDVASGSERDRLTFPDEGVYRPAVADGTLLVPTTERLLAYR